MPPPGPARGEYFKTVKSAFTDWGNRNLAARLLKDEPITFQDFAVAFPDARVKDIATVAESMEGCLLNDAAFSGKPEFIGQGVDHLKKTEGPGYACGETA
jgi:hypothetical protein